MVVLVRLMVAAAGLAVPLVEARLTAEAALSGRVFERVAEVVVGEYAVFCNELFLDFGLRTEYENTLLPFARRASSDTFSISSGILSGQ